jgi:hypothetical protein
MTAQQKGGVWAVASIQRGFSLFVLLLHQTRSINDGNHIDRTNVTAAVNFVILKST